MIGIILFFGSAVIAYRQTLAPRPRFSTNFLPPTAEAMLLEQADGAARRTITVRVIGAASDEGTMKLAFYTGAEGFNDPDQALAVNSWEIRDGICEARIGLPAEIEELAIAAYHDANNNGILDRNALGIPSERYGFSGDARGLIGPPEYSEAVVPVTAEPIQLSIR